MGKHTSATRVQPFSIIRVLLKGFVCKAIRHPRVKNFDRSSVRQATTAISKRIHRATRVGDEGPPSTPSTQGMSSFPLRERRHQGWRWIRVMLVMGGRSRGRRYRWNRRIDGSVESCTASVVSSGHSPSGLRGAVSGGCIPAVAPVLSRGELPSASRRPASGRRTPLLLPTGADAFRRSALFSAYRFSTLLAHQAYTCNGLERTVVRYGKRGWLHYPTASSL